MLHLKKTIEKTNLNSDPLDIYLFDAQGLCVIKNVFPIEQIINAKKIIEEKFQ